MKKIVVIGIIVILIAVAVAPSINANVSRLPVKSKLIETAVRIHRARGITPYTLKLTEKESDEVDRIFDNLEVSLDSAETGEEIDEILNDAVVSLYKLGMFPKDMTVEEAQQLVKGESQNPSVKSPLRNLGTVDENFNCRIAGETTETYMFDLCSPLLNKILEIVRGLIYGALGWGKFNFFYFKGEIGNISFGEYYWNIYGGNRWSPSKGWVWTNGSNGVIKWEGEFYGDIETRMVFEDVWFDTALYVYMGVNKFEGLWIDRWTQPPYFIGNAEHVGLTYN